MANKLRDVFNQDERFLKETIQFHNKNDYNEFLKALEIVNKEGKAVRIPGRASMSMHVKSGASNFPMEKSKEATDIIIGPSPEEVTFDLDIDGENVKFILIRYRHQNGCNVQTQEGFPFRTILFFDIKKETVNIKIKPSLDKAADVDDMLYSIKIERAFLKKFLNVDQRKKKDLDAVIDYIDRLYKIFEKMKFVEETLGRKFIPGKVDLKNAESVMDLVELCLLIRDKKVIRINKKMTDSTGRLNLASNEEIAVGEKIAMTFMGEVQYLIWSETIRLYCANLLNNAIVKSIEKMEDDQTYIVYGENENKPMYITYRGFLTEDEARQEHDKIMENMEEYENAKTVVEYIEEGY